MASWQRPLLLSTTLIVLTCATQCGSTSDAPPAQVLLYVDTDAPSASKARAGKWGFLSDSAVDTLRVEILDANNRTIRWRDIPAPDEANWPISFGIDASNNATVARIRLRAFRAQTAELSMDGEPDAGAEGGPSLEGGLKTGLQQYEPNGPYTIDRVVEVPIPSSKGSFAFRVLLKSACRGKLPNFLSRKTCIDSDHQEEDYREGISVVSPSERPAREASWWPSNFTDCDNNPCPKDTKCIPGGFFMLGNSKVVGFSSLQRHDAVPPHPVAMKPFCLDIQEVSVKTFAGLVKDHPLLMPTHGTPGVPYQAATGEFCTWWGSEIKVTPPDLLVPVDPQYNPPMNCVSWTEAREACKQRGGRLPTEAEWEYVASGRGRGYLFPWNDTPPTCASASLGRKDELGTESCSTVEMAKIESVGRHASNVEGTSDVVDEVQDMAGSVSEWMMDSFSPYDSEPNCWGRDGLLEHPVCRLPTVADHSVRGGNWASPLEVAYVALRWTEKTDTHTELIGFRCVFPIGTDPVPEDTDRPEDTADAGQSEPGDGGAP